MSYVIFRTVQGQHPVLFEMIGFTNSFATEAAAKAAITRLANKGKIELADWWFADSAYYYDKIDYEYVGARGFKVRCSTPYCCDPNFETYHSM